MAAALTLGAEAAWIGTRFLTALEARTHDHYRDRVRTASAGDSRYSGCFDGGWPDAPHRALVNQTLLRWERAGCPPTPHRPGEGDVVAIDGNGGQHLRYGDMIARRDLSGELDELALYAGQSVELVRDVLPAAEIVAGLVAGAVQALDRGQGRRQRG